MTDKKSEKMDVDPVQDPNNPMLMPDQVGFQPPPVVPGGEEDTTYRRPAAAQGGAQPASAMMSSGAEVLQPPAPEGSAQYAGDNDPRNDDGESE